MNLYNIAIATTVILGLSCETASADIEPIEIAGWEIEPHLRATVTLSPGRDNAGAREAELFTGDLQGELRFERVLDNGVEIGARFAGRLQRDHPARSGFSGQIGPFDANLNDSTLRGAFTGLTTGGLEEDVNARVQLETAFIYADGGYGQILLGRDIGIARRFHEGSPSVFSLHTTVNARLDSSGIATVLTRNDLTGPAAKLSYATPRLLGLRLGASYTPRANVSGLDRDPDRDVAGVGEPRLENGLETAFNFSHRFRKAGVRLETYGAYSRADLETGPLRQDAGTVEVWSTGGRFEWQNIEFGADWLTTDNGGGRYKAWSIGAQTRFFDIDWSAEYGESNDNLTGIDGHTWSVGAAREFWEKLTITAGLQQQKLEILNSNDATSTGPVIEMTLRY